MTEEQIKQNAEEYANSMRLSTENPPSDYHIGIYDGYIAGAHSRDEEIEQLEWEKKHYQDIAWKLAVENERFIKSEILENKMRIDLINEREQLKQELNKFRNPWRDAKKDPPEVGQEVIGILDTGEIFDMKRTDNNIWFTDILTIDCPQYWMPIPKFEAK